MKKFDRKFGAHFLSNLPTSPGVYCFYDQDDVLIYVGKAKNLRRRLSQYRNAKRHKRDRKKRKIVDGAARISWEELKSELDADLQEIRLIQKFRPKMNISGAYFFLYPMIGMRTEKGDSFFCLTTTPSAFPSFTFFGAFRSRELTGEAFFSLMYLLGFIGHRIPGKRVKEKVKVPYSYLFGFRQIPPDWLILCGEFLRGISQKALEELSLGLVNNAGARARSSEVQEHLKTINTFWESEARLLAEVIQWAGHKCYPVTQEDRDPLLLRFRKHKKMATA